MPHIAQLDTMNGRFKHFTLVKISAKIGVFKRSKLTADPMKLHFGRMRAVARRADPGRQLASFRTAEARDATWLVYYIPNLII